MVRQPMIVPTAPCFALLVPVLLAVAAVRAAAPDRPIVVAGTLEASLAQPRVYVQLGDGERVLTAEPGALESLLGDGKRVRWFPAYLDTGASAYVLSRGTADRFGVKRVPGAIYREVGLHGEVDTGVTEPYAIALAGSTGGSEAAPLGGFGRIQRGVALEVNLHGAAGLAALIGDVDVVGMPAISRLLVEIDPAPMVEEQAGDALDRLAALGAGPLVRLHDRARRRQRTDVVIPLEYMDFSRRQPGERGPRPELAPNPMVEVEARNAGAASTGSWLLDTGAAASIISTAQAKRLGLYGEDGKPRRDADFALPLTGIGGAVEETGGYVIDLLRVPSRGGASLEFPRAHVLVRDISIEIRGETVTLDGVLGMNLLLPSASGLADGFPDERSDPPFARIWIDGRKRRLILEPRKRP